MKTGRILVKIFVVLILALALIIPSTFSWYDHNGSLTGGIMVYKRDDLPVSAGAISMVTKQFEMQGNKLKYDTKGNKAYQGNDLTSSGDTVLGGAGEYTAQYYGTTITNSGTSPAYVNLYLRNFTNSTNAYIGTLQPSLTHKGLSSSVHLANKNKIRVYFQCDIAKNWNDASAKKYVVYKTKSGAQSCAQITATTPTNRTNTYTYNKLTNTKTYYVDLADNTTEFYFATDGNKSGFDTSTFTTTLAWYRTNTITHVQPEMCYYLTGVSDDTTFNAQYATLSVTGGISIKTYFDTLTINKGQHANINLLQGTNYTGSSITYASADNSLVEVNANTGYVTAKTGFVPSGNTPASTTLTTTITGSLGDTASVTTAVSNPPTLTYAPVVLNVEVPAKTTETVDGQSVTKNGEVEIVWYIENHGGSGSDISFGNIYYTK